MKTRIRPTAPAVLLLVLALPGMVPGALAAAEEGTVRGSVRDRAERPLAGALVVLHPLGREARTAADGSFELAGVPAGSYLVEARAAGYTIEVAVTVLVTAGGTTDLAFRLTAVPVPVEEVVVTASHSLLREEPIAVVNLDREEILELPHLGDDLYRAMAVLPGTSAKDFSARFSVRGGLHDDVLVRLDGLELFEPFHIKDLGGVFSAVDPEVIGGVDLTPGSFAVEHGDRMGGVLDMWTRRPSERRLSLGLSFSNAWLGSAGTFDDNRGRWLGSVRRGFFDLLLGFVGESQGKDEDDDWTLRYWDSFGKLEHDLTPSQTLSFKLLFADDGLSIQERDGFETLDMATSFGNLTVGVDHQAVLGKRLVVGTLLSAARVERDRRLRWSELDELVAMDDDRQLDVFDLRQDWRFSLSDRSFLKWGFEARRCDVEYDYFNEIVDANFIDDPRFPQPVRGTRFAGRLDGEQYALWLADRVRLGERMTAELGVRYDEQSLTDDSQLSPRLNLVYDLGGAGLVRAGWGRFYQTQRIHELNVQFGDTGFYPPQSADQATLGYERELPGGHRLRVDAYRRDVDDPIPRWETLFNTFNPIPEIEPDLIRIAADRVLAEGVELHLRGPGRPKLDWWVSYTLSSIEDRVDGRWQPRSIDQTHALTANLNYRPSRKWNLTWIWLYHTGWPTTAISGELVRDESCTSCRSIWRVSETIGPFYAERLPDYHRLDLRASRTTPLREGRFTVFFDIQNLYDRENLRGLEVEDRAWIRQPDGRYLAVYKQEAWFGVMPSFGITWER